MLNCFLLVQNPLSFRLYLGGYITSLLLLPSLLDASLFSLFPDCLLLFHFFVGVWGGGLARGVVWYDCLVVCCVIVAINITLPHFKLVLALRMVDELHLTPKRNWA